MADPMKLPHDSPLVQTMATCHSLVKINGELTGYPMDIKLFESIEWVSSSQTLCTVKRSAIVVETERNIINKTKRDLYAIRKWYDNKFHSILSMFGSLPRYHLSICFSKIQPRFERERARVYSY